jgi:uroporphyrin-III C-methyltransferase/precorrin-2 dehydrogenase/sirohydrochlorin ferrochelatase
MPQKTLAELSFRAMAQGLASDTPAVAVARATRSDQQVIAGTVGTLAAQLAATPLDGPVLVMIGRALAAVATQADRAQAARAVAHA